MGQVESCEQNLMIERFRPFSVIAENAGKRGDLDQIYANFDELFIALREANGNLVRIDWSRFTDNILDDMMSICSDPKEAEIIGNSIADQALDLFSWIIMWQRNSAYNAATLR